MAADSSFPIAVSQDGLDTARGVLRRTFGHADFRGLQARVIGEILAGRSALAVLPTGAAARASATRFPLWFGLASVHRLGGRFGRGRIAKSVPCPPCIRASIATPQNQAGSISNHALHGPVAGTPQRTVLERYRGRRDIGSYGASNSDGSYS
jgi:hypothetical protein